MKEQSPITNINSAIVPIIPLFAIKKCPIILKTIMINAIMNKLFIGFSSSFKDSETQIWTYSSIQLGGNRK